jgi:hypothetical protein
MKYFNRMHLPRSDLILSLSMTTSAVAVNKSWSARSSVGLLSALRKVRKGGGTLVGMLSERRGFSGSLLPEVSSFDLIIFDTRSLQELDLDHFEVTIILDGMFMKIIEYPT